MHGIAVVTALCGHRGPNSGSRSSPGPLKLPLIIPVLVPPCRSQVKELFKSEEISQMPLVVSVDNTRPTESLVGFFYTY